MKISPARTAAFDILLRIETEKSFSSVLLLVFENELSAMDRGLCHEITLGTLRRQLYLDRIIDSLTGKKKLDIQVRIAMRIALYQIRFLDKIPAYSAINESVNLVERARKRSAKGFVNAILRRSLREETFLEFVDQIDELAITTSHPHWLIERWVASFGFDFASKLANANNGIPPAAFRVIASDSAVDLLVERARPSAVVPGCFLLQSFDPEILQLSDSGNIYLQDEASQMVAASVEIPEKGRFLDVCAAPGGKTGLIAGRFQASSNLLAAGDLRWQRVLNLRENCAQQRVGFVSALQFDATFTLPFAEQSFDAVLVDAPCSGTGTIRHNPELRYFLSSADVCKLPLKQLSILTNASKLIAGDGTLVYSTCSLEREENEEVCVKFLLENPDFVQIRPNVDERFLTDDGFARTWPHMDGMDGFFIAAFKPIANGK